MLSLFPDLLNWSWYVPLVFRVFLGIYLWYISWIIMRDEGRTENEDDRLTWIFLGVIFFLFGLAYIAGLYVQALGSTGFALALFALYLHRKKSHHAQESVPFYLLIGIVSLSLVFLGAGPYAIDLPL